MKMINLKKKGFCLLEFRSAAKERYKCARGFELCSTCKGCPSQKEGQGDYLMALLTSPICSSRLQLTGQLLSVSCRCYIRQMVDWITFFYFPVPTVQPIRVPWLSLRGSTRSTQSCVLEQNNLIMYSCLCLNFDTQLSVTFTKQKSQFSANACAHRAVSAVNYMRLCSFLWTCKYSCL